MALFKQSLSFKFEITYLIGGKNRDKHIVSGLIFFFLTVNVSPSSSNRTLIGQRTYWKQINSNKNLPFLFFFFLLVRFLPLQLQPSAFPNTLLPMQIVCCLRQRHGGFCRKSELYSSIPTFMCKAKRHWSRGLHRWTKTCTAIGHLCTVDLLVIGR